MKIRLIPQDREFFTLFDTAGTNILKAAQLLEQMISDWPEGSGLAREILICEQEGDQLTHDIIQRLNSTFVTPMDREDIYALATGLDDVVDYAEEAADHFGLYKVEAPMEQALQLASVLVACCEQLSTALGKLRGFKNLEPYWIEINRLENDGDRIARDAVASLFVEGIDPIFVIRWKDLFAMLENAIDATEDVASIIENICVKNA